MTKDAAIDFMQHQSEYERGVIGFMIVPMRGYDIERFCDDDVCERYRELTREQQIRFLSWLTDDMSRVFESDSDWTALDLMYCAKDEIENDNNVDNGLLWLMDKAMKEDKNG